MSTLAQRDEPGELSMISIPVPSDLAETESRIAKALDSGQWQPLRARGRPSAAMRRPPSSLLQAWHSPCQVQVGRLINDGVEEWVLEQLLDRLDEERGEVPGVGKRRGEGVCMRELRGEGRGLSALGVG
jgi:hypothetical protein